MAKLKLVGCCLGRGGPSGIWCVLEILWWCYLFMFLFLKKSLSYFPFIVRLLGTQGWGPDGGQHWASGSLKGDGAPWVPEGPSTAAPWACSWLKSPQCSEFSHLGTSSEPSPPTMARQLHAKGSSSDLLLWSMTVLSVMAKLIVRNHLLADSWMLIMIGTFTALRPKFVDICWWW